MEIDEKYKPIHDQILTTQQNELILDALKQAKNSIFDQTKKSHEILKNKLPFDLADLIFESAKEANIDLEDSNQAQNFYKEIETSLQNRPIVDLTLAFGPSYELLQKISNWWNKNIEPNILLNIKIDKKLVAGAIIGYNGIMKDFTLRQILGTYLENKA